MSKRLFVAPATAGKTGFALNLARERATSLAQEVRICVPNALQARMWRDRLAKAGGAIGIHVLMFDELVAACLLEAGESYIALNDAVQNRLIRSLFESLYLRHYAALVDKSGFVQVNKRFIGELKAGNIDPQPFAAAVAELEDSPRLGELADIYDAYQKEVIQNSWADRAGLQWLAADALQERAPEACKDWPILIVDGFDDLSPSQLKLLKILAERVQEFQITLTAAERAYYPRYERLISNVERELKVIAEPLPQSGRKVASSTLEHLTRHIFALPSAGQVTNDGAIILRETSDQAAEARTALRWLKTLIVRDGMSPGDVALLAREMTPYQPYISEIAAEFGLPIRMLDGQPLGQNPAIAALLDLLRLHLPASGENQAVLPRRGVITSWRSPYFAWSDGEIRIGAADADTLDEYSRQKRVISGLDQWEAAFRVGLAADQSPDRPGDNEKDTLFPRSTVEDLQEKFNLFLSQSKPSTARMTVSEYVDWLKRLMGHDPNGDEINERSLDSLFIMERANANPATAVADLTALQQLRSILDEMAWAEELVGSERSLNFATFFAELAGVVAGARYTIPVANGEAAIIVANTAQVRAVSFRGVALMGMSEGSFPRPVSEDPFLRDSDRHILREKHAMPLLTSTQSAEQAFFYEAIAGAREKLLLTRPVLADNGAEWLASPYWEAARRLVDCQVETIPGEGVVPIAETASQAEWLESLAAFAAAGEWSPGQDEPQKVQIERAAQIWLQRQTAEPSAWAGDLTPLTGELKARYGAQEIWSASRLESYRTCGFLFFVQHVLKLRPRAEPAEGLDAGQLGLLYHKIIEQVMAHSDGQKLDEEAVKVLVYSIAAPILDDAPRMLGFRETPWWSQSRAEIIENIILSVLSLAEGEYEFLTAEASFGFDGSELVIHNGEDTLRLHGYIDRVDISKDGRLRIIDYKTGGKSRYTKPAFAEGRKLQLPLYALAAQEALELGEIEDGFYWHFQQQEASGFQLSKAEGGVEGAVETAVYYAWETVHSVRNGQFAPLPPREGCPHFCPAASFCNQYSPTSW